MKALSITVAAVFLATAAHAEVNADGRYDNDRQKAIKALTPELREQCLRDFSQRAKTGIKPLGEFEFSDALSRDVYQSLYWKASDRGVAFITPVEARDVKYGKAGNVACFYAVNEKGLSFEFSQQVQWKLTTAQAK